MPEPAPTRAAQPIEVEVRKNPPIAIPEAPKPLTPPVVAPPEPPRPVAIRTPVHEPQIRDRPKEKEPPIEEPKPPEFHEQPPTGPVPPQPDNQPQKRGPVDLTLHALPGTPGSDGVVVRAGPGGGTMVGGVPAAPRKEWKMRGDAGDPITGKIKEAPVDKFPLTKVGPNEYVYKGGQFSAHISPDGSVSFDDKNIRDFNGTSGSFDLTDLLMKSKKEDPYRHEKKKFMEATAEKRAAMAREARAAAMADSLGRLPAHLEAIWNDRRRSAKARRDLLFSLWKESASDDEAGQGGKDARGIIESFIRSRLPEGSPDAYTEDELAGFNRNGRDRFAPYK